MPIVDGLQTRVYFPSPFTVAIKVDLKLGVGSVVN